jgi:hypothetical protein
MFRETVAVLWQVFSKTPKYMVWAKVVVTDVTAGAIYRS